MLRAGLIGFPSVGKTTIFRLMTAAPDVAHGAHHGKVDAHVGVARVPDERLDRLTALFNPRKRVPATVEMADIAGTTRADAKALLDVGPFRNADALLHVVRLFGDASVPHAPGPIDPLRDVRAMEDELILADLGVVERRLERLSKDLKKGATPELTRERDLLVQCQAVLEAGKPLRSLGLSGGDARQLRGFQFLSAKPLLLVLNLDEADVAATDTAAANAGLEEFLTEAGAGSVAVCAKIELEISQLEPDDAQAFLLDLNLKESGLNRVIRATYDLLGYISFFTVGEDECRSWSVPRGTHAQEAAGEIHSDISRGFIRAEVTRYEHLIARGALAACREHGELRLEGKDYVVQDGDVVNFRFAT